MDIYGRDINSNFNFVNGDLETVENYSNLTQAIINRLNTDINFYNWCYTRYGGELHKNLGIKSNKALDYVGIEIKSILQQDPRIVNLTVNCTKKSSKSIDVSLNLKLIGNDNIVPLNLVIQDGLIVKIV